MSLGPDDLVLCAANLSRTSLTERMAVAAEAGFRGVSLFLDDLDREKNAGRSDAELRTLLADHDLQVAELDPLLTWVPGVPAGGEGFWRWAEDDFYAAAQAVGARSINAVSYGVDLDRAALVDAFGGLCERAAVHDLLVHLEFMPFSSIRDLETALSIVDAAGQPNSGVLFDAWHHLRGGGGPESLRAAAPRVLAIQLDDAPAQAEANLVEETLHRRLLPGEGAARVAESMRELDAGGCTAPVGVEVFSDAFESLSPSELARLLADATRRVLAEARDTGAR